MRVSPFARILVLLLVLSLVATQAPGVGAQAARTPLVLDFYMSNAAPTVNETQLGTDNVMLLAPGTSGTPATVDSGCAPSGRPQSTPVAAWISDPVWDYGATVVNLSNVVVTLGPGPSLQPPLPAVPNPVTTGQVILTLRVTGGPDGAHDIGEVSATIPGPSGATPDPTGAQMPGSVTFDFSFFEPSAGAHPAQLPIVLVLSVQCASAASFSITSGAFSMSYLYGSPDDPDTDGDGIPDDLDDDADGDGFTREEEAAVGSLDTDAASTPDMDADGDGFSLSEEAAAGTSDNDRNDVPGAGGFPWLLIILIVLVVLLLAGGAVGAVAVVGRKIKISVSHDGFQAVDKGQTAEYEVTVLATGKKEEAIPVQLSLKGVPEDWTAHLEPDHLTLYSGEGSEAQTVRLRLVPPPDEAYEAEAQVTVTATPTDEEGNTSAMKPGSSVKTKTIVNIGVTPPEGEKKAKKPKKPKEPKEEAPADEPGTAAEATEKPARRFGLKRKKKGDDAEPDAPAVDATDAAPAAAPAAAGGKPSIAMGQMVHDPADFSAGDEVATKVTVRNKGDAPVAGLRLSLYVNDERADQQVVDLAAGESKEVSFTWTAQPDENRVRIKGGLAGA